MRFHPSGTFTTTLSVKTLIIPLENHQTCRQIETHYLSPYLQAQAFLVIQISLASAFLKIQTSLCLNKVPSLHLTGQLTTLCMKRDKNFSALEWVSSAQASVQELLLLLAQQQWVSHLPGFLVGQQGCENLSPAVPCQTDVNNIAVSRHQTASWSPQRHSPAQPGGRDNQNY